MEDRRCLANHRLAHRANYLDELVPHAEAAVAEEMEEAEVVVVEKKEL
jgi:hypothetical protein